MVGPNRPAVDVVIPFLGSREQLADLLARTDGLALAAGDTLTIVENGADALMPGWRDGQRRTLHAGDQRSSYFARNRGAEVGQAEWLLFLDADVESTPDLIDLYFAELPSDHAAVLAGGVMDEPTSDGTTRIAARYAMLRRSMSQENTLEGRWGYAQTSNCAVRRAPFAAVGGFAERIRSGGDADLCFRLRRSGWAIEGRPGATVAHRSRRTVWALARQRARHGAGAAWLNRAYPGSFPPHRSLGVVRWSLGELAAAGRCRMARDTDAAVLHGVGVLSHWAFELGRLLPNQARPRRT